MHQYLTWLEFGAKLCLFILVAFNLLLFTTRNNSKIISTPFITYLVSPFFFSYKITEALGRGSINHTCYLTIAILLNIYFVVISFRTFSKKSLKVLRKTFAEKIKAHSGIVVTVLFIFIFFYMRGLYLEYPGDAIVYFQRVGQSNQDSVANLSSLWNYDAQDTFFSSLQQWFTGSDSLLRSKLRFIAAINSCALCFSTYKTAYWCTQNKKSSVIAVFLSLSFYGNLQISFYLYKILQGATLAMIVYLEALPLMQLLLISHYKDIAVPSTPSRITWFLISLWIMRDCHQEKVLYIFSALSCTSIFIVFKSYVSRRKPPTFSTLSSLVTIVLTLLLFLSDKQTSEPLPNYLVSQWLSLRSIEVMTYWPAPPNSAYLLIDIFSLGLVAIVIMNSDTKSKNFFMATVALSPCFLFLNPIAITGFLKLTISGNLYRVMLAGLPWIFLPLACNFLQDFYNIEINKLPLLMLCLGLISYPPIYGKLPHVLTPVPHHADGRNLSPIVEYLLQHASIEPADSIKILADPYVNSYLAAWPQFQVASNRWLRSDPNLYNRILSEILGSEISKADLATRIENENYQAIIINKSENNLYESWLGKVTSHWPPDLLRSHRSLFSAEKLKLCLEQNPEYYLPSFKENGFFVYTSVGSNLSVSRHEHFSCGS